MADEDDSQKTEDPTGRKLEKAREKGQVVSSQEVKTFGLLIASTILLMTIAPAVMRQVVDVTRLFIEQPDAIPVDFEQMRLLLYGIAGDIGWILLPMMGVLMIAAVLSSVIQSGLIWSWEKIKPDLSKISVLKGFKRLVSLRAVVEFLKGVGKLIIVAVVAFGMAIPLFDDIDIMPQFPILLLLDRIHLLAIALAAGTAAVMAAIAALDYMYQKYDFTKQMRMTKQEVKDEYKQAEGDPQIKARIRKIRNERAQQRMMASVPDAAVVITNPTHYSVALKYEMEGMEAPRLVAKGVDHIAFRIREVAKEHDVPIVENPPLARALYASVELDEEIPVEHYKAVAEVIGYVMQLKGKTGGGY